MVLANPDTQTTTLSDLLIESMASATRQEAESAIGSRAKLIPPTLDPLTFAVGPEAALRRSRSSLPAFCGLNRQFIRASILLRLMNTLSPDVFIETGCFRGETCLLVAGQTNQKQPHPPSVWYPAYSAEVEIGSKRGFILLMPSSLDLIGATIPSTLLRRED